MRYKITHTTTYHYSEAVPVCHNEIRLTPRDGRGQNCLSHQLVIKPTPAALAKRSDYFSNPAHYFSIQEGHRKLTVKAVSRVDLRPPTLPDPQQTPPWEQVRDQIARAETPATLEALQFTDDSPSIQIPPSAGVYGATSFPAGRPILAGVIELTQRIYRDFQYDPRATTVSTPVDEVIELRRGVCQDFAHLQIAALRAQGLAARYVSGYLRTYPAPGRPRLVGADASHAWVSVYCGEAGWIDVDPTNNCLVQTDHITIAWGRDYSDVCPIKGVFIGGGVHHMTVSVDVAPVEPRPRKLLR
jgi:transglutaminase-like putative cysteine protease